MWMGDALWASPIPEAQEAPISEENTFALISFTHLGSAYDFKQRAVQLDLETTDLCEIKNKENFQNHPSSAEITLYFLT